MTTFVASFFTAALVQAVNDTFHEGEPSVDRSVRAAWWMKTTIAVWSFVAAVASLILRQFEESDSPLPGVARAIFSLGRTVTTFFVVPVIVFEDVDVRSMFSRSAETFRETWGETLGAGLGLRIVQFLLAAAAVLGIGLAVLVGAASPGAGLGVGVFDVVVGLVAAFLIGQTIRDIAKTALYLYAREGSVTQGFTDFDFETLGGRAERRATPDRDRVEGRI